MAISLPSLIVSDFPNGMLIGLLSGTPMAFPRGYRIAEGPSV